MFLKIDKNEENMHFGAHSDDHYWTINTKRENRLDLNCSIYSKLSIKPLMKKIEWIVKEENHFEKWHKYAFFGTFGPS